MVSSPEELDLYKLVRENPKVFYETIVRAVFRNPYVGFYKNVVWEAFWASISDGNKTKAEKVFHFYYQD